MLEILFLLLPLAAAYGWYMGYRSATQDKQKQSSHISRQYVTGLNMLLSDQSDEAVDHFIELLQVDDDAVDTHFALGNLFRSRGEVDRAIRIHQNLISREELSIDQKNLASEQLAKDYMAAGLLDRAEKIFEFLLSEPEHKELALKQLVNIYQQTQEWQKAINYATKLLKMGKKNSKIDIGHYYCELALIETKQNKTAQAIEFYKKALSVDPSCVRASIALGRVYYELDDNYKSITYLASVIHQDITFISETLPLLKQIYLEEDKSSDLLNFLYDCIAKKGGVSPELMLADLVVQHDGIAPAVEFLTKQLVKNPTMKGFHALIDLHLKEAEEGRAKESLNTLKYLVGEQLKVKHKYRCRKCGFSTHSLYWHCPSCKSWGSIKPIRGLDGE